MAGELGQYEKGLLEALEAVRLDPVTNFGYDNLVYAYLPLNRLQDVKATVAAQAKKLESPQLHLLLYSIAFLQDDAPGMAQQVAWSKDKTGVEDILLYLEGDTAAYFGQLTKAREFSRRAVESAQRGNEKETAVGYEAEAALREALFGNLADAREGHVRHIVCGGDLYPQAAPALPPVPSKRHRVRADLRVPTACR